MLPVICIHNYVLWFQPEITLPDICYIHCGKHYEGISYDGYGRYYRNSDFIVFRKQKKSDLI